MYTCNADAYPAFCFAVVCFKLYSIIDTSGIAFSGDDGRHNYSEGYFDADFAFLGQESFWAANAARCAGEQGKFWEYHDYLYNSQRGENQGAFSKNNLKSFAGALNLDGGKFNACLDSEKYSEEIIELFDEVYKLYIELSEFQIYSNKQLYEYILENPEKFPQFFNNQHEN